LRHRTGWQAPLFVSSISALRRLENYSTFPTILCPFVGKWNRYMYERFPFCTRLCAMVFLSPLLVLYSLKSM